MQDHYTHVIQMENKLISLVELLGGLPDVEMSAFSRLIKPIQVSRNQVLLRQGIPCTKIWFLCSGAVRMYRIEGKKDITLNLFTHSRCFTDLVALREQIPALLHIETLVPSEIIEINANDLFSFFEVSLHAERIVRRMYEQLLYEETTRLHDVLYRDATARYNNLIKNNPDALQIIPLKIIASYLNVKPETLSRIRKKIL